MNTAPIDTYVEAWKLIAYKDGYELLLRQDRTDPDGRWYFQVQCYRKDIVSGKMGLGRGGKAYLSPHMTRTELVHIAFGLFKAYEEHECREWFRYRGRRVFGPHISVEAMWDAAPRLDVRQP